MAVYEYFPGANTPKGFYSYYDYILKEREAKRIIILKGGPGTGKSTFMKKTAKHLMSLGYDTELLHCSSDPNSLDGVCARQIGFLILDGTSPHIVDPKCPGAVDEIINLGECWDKEKISKNKAEIIRTQEEISAFFKDAYSYLASAKSLQTKMMRNSEAHTDMSFVRHELEKLKKELDLNIIAAKTGNERKAFISAITPAGRINYLDTFAENAKKVYKIKTKSKTAAQMFMNNLAQSLKECGYNIRTFYCPMSPDETVEHISTNGIFFTTCNDYHNLKSTSHIINLDNGNIPCNTHDCELYNSLLNNAEASVISAKKLHDKLEEYYVPYMDFEKIGKLCDNVIKSIS